MSTGATDNDEHTVGELLEDKVELDVEGIDRAGYSLNAYQPRLQTVAAWLASSESIAERVVASTTLMAPMSKAFVRRDIACLPKLKGSRSCILNGGISRTWKLGAD